MTDKDAEELARQEWKELPVELRRAMLKKAQDDLAWQRISGKVYRRSAFAGAALTGILAFRQDLAHLLALLAQWLDGSARP